MSILSELWELLWGHHGLTPPDATPGGSVIEGKPLRYLIGLDRVPGIGQRVDSDAVTMVSYDTDLRPLGGTVAAYVNLFDEKNSGEYGPYMRDASDTARKYHEGHVDPRGPGFIRNLRDQLVPRRSQGFQYIELDNMDAYHVADVRQAMDLAQAMGFKVFVKNPTINDYGESMMPLLNHPAAVAVIIEWGGVECAEIHSARVAAGKPRMPVWYVTFGQGKQWAYEIAEQAKNFHNIGVTYSPRGEYVTSLDMHRPL